MTTSAPLAEFLRARREQLSPADVGLRSSGRRRTPGLRREEVATLAGVSIDYLVRLEQGRDTNPSPAVLAAIADALRLNERERHHLAVLATHTSNADYCPGGHGADSAVAATTQILLDQLDPTPAFVAGPYADLLGWNSGWSRVAAPMGFLDGERPNLARFAFMHPAAAEVHVDWEQEADEQAASLRVSSLPFRDDVGLIALLAELQSAPAFASRWTAHQVMASRGTTHQVRHPDHGILTFHPQALALAGESGQRLVVWLAADDVTQAAFVPATVAEPISPAHLRVVGDA